MKDLFFGYCPNSGLEFHEALEDALEYASNAIQNYLEDSWDEDVTGICVGEITHRAKMCEQVFPDGEIDVDGYDEAGDYWNPDWDYKCNYKMLPVEENPAPAVPAPDVSGLTEALRQYQHNDGSGMVSGYDKLLVDRHVADLVEALEDCITWLEPYDDIKPRDWKTDRENLRRAHQSARTALDAYRKQGGES